MPMARLLFLAFVTMSVAACTSNNFGARLDHLEGRHIDVAVEYLGIPDNQFAIDAREVFVWGHQTLQSYERPIGTYGGYDSSRGVFGGVGIVFGGGYTRDTYLDYCEIKALVNADNIIEAMQYETSGSGCYEYSDAAKRIETDLAPPDAATPP